MEKDAVVDLFLWKQPCYLLSCKFLFRAFIYTYSVDVYRYWITNTLEHNLCLDSSNSLLPYNNHMQCFILQCHANCFYKCKQHLLYAWLITCANQTTIRSIAHYSCSSYSCLSYSLFIYFRCSWTYVRWHWYYAHGQCNMKPISSVAFAAVS